MARNLILFVIVVASLPLAQLSHWNYGQQDKWPPMYCQNSISQSPIDLIESNMVKQQMSPLIFGNWKQDYNGSIENNGHTIVVKLPNSDGSITVTGGGLPGTYVLEQFHFHWGSEHTFEGDRKAFEAHYVTYNKRFKTFTEALKYKNGIAVLGVLYDLTQQNNLVLKPITSLLGKLMKYSSKESITINPSKLLPNDLSRYYRYWGSLTTPNCDEVVLWTVFPELCKISSEQVDQFASVNDKEDNKLTSNYREVQPLYERNVYDVQTSGSSKTAG